MNANRVAQTALLLRRVVARVLSLQHGGQKLFA